jgi:hypothetical protein
MLLFQPKFTECQSLTSAEGEPWSKFIGSSSPPFWRRFEHVAQGFTGQLGLG